VSYIDDFEKQLTEIAKIKGCDGIICGHIHQAALKEIDGCIYMNSGDWVESMSALAEDAGGNWSLVYYSDTSAYNSSQKKLDAINLEDNYSLKTEELNLRKRTA
jgi:hypothetical protein